MRSTMLRERGLPAVGERLHLRARESARCGSTCVRSCCTRSARSAGGCRRSAAASAFELDDQRLALGELARRARSGGGCGTARRTCRRRRGSDSTRPRTCCGAPGRSSSTRPAAASSRPTAASQSVDSASASARAHSASFFARLSVHAFLRSARSSRRREKNALHAARNRCARSRPASRGDRTERLPLGLQFLEARRRPCAQSVDCGERFGFLDDRGLLLQVARRAPRAASRSSVSQRLRMKSVAVRKRSHSRCAEWRGASATSCHFACSSRSARAVAARSDVLPASSSLLSEATMASAIAMSCSWRWALAKRRQSSISRSSRTRGATCLLQRAQRGDGVVDVARRVGARWPRRGRR